MDEALLNNENERLQTLMEAEETRYEVASPTFVASLSAFVMGLGQFYNGQMRAAKVFFAGQMCLLLYMYDYWASGEVSTAVIGWTSPFMYGFFMALLIGGGVVVWLFNIYDAYSTAKFCEMIFDRTLPNLDDDEEELLAAHLRTNTFGVDHHRGASRQMVYGAVAIFLYSAAIFSMGSYFSGASSNSLEDLRQKIAHDSTDAFSHLQLGELLLADGEYLNAAREFREVTNLSKNPSWTCAAYTKLSIIYGRMGDEATAKKMLQKAAAAAASAQGASGPATYAPPATTVTPGPTKMAVVPPTKRPVPTAQARLTDLEISFALDKARTDLEVGHYDEALLTLDGLLQKGANTAAIFGLKSQAYFARGDLDLAAKEVQKALSLDSREPQALHTALDLAIDSGNSSSMVAALNAYRQVAPSSPEAATKVSMALYKSGKLAQAYQVANEQLTITPGHVGLLLVSFRVARDEGRDSQAHQAALALVEAEYRDVEVYRFLALEAQKRKDLDGALKFARALAVLEPGKSQWLLLQAEILQKKGAWRPALEAYRNALVVGATGVDVYLPMSRVAVRAGIYDEAIKYLKLAAEKAPRDTMVLKELALAYRAKNELDRAMGVYQDALAIDREDLELKYLAGDLSLTRNDPGGAYDLLRTVFTVAPTYRNVAYLFGHTCDLLGRKEEAIEAFEKVRLGTKEADEAKERLQALKQAPLPPPATSVPLHTAGTSKLPDTPQVPVEQYAELLKRAELAFRDGRNEDALSLYDQVLQLLPNHFRSLFQKGVTLNVLGRQQEALTVLLQAKARNPKDMDLLEKLGNLYADLGQYDKAVAEFEAAVRLDPKHLGARYNLGWLFEKLKQYDKAEEHFKTIIWFYPEYVKAHDFLGNLYFVQGKFPLALKSFEKLLAVDSDDETVRFKAALTLLQLGRADRARREFMFLQKTLDADHPLASKVRDYLRKLR